jgi:hypothetical protein
MLGHVVKHRSRFNAQVTCQNRIVACFKKRCGCCCKKPPSKKCKTFMAHFGFDIEKDPHAREQDEISA